ncbi:MAG: hypothetical protein ABI051_12630 [Vicinamibacterales bacterium]
MTADRRSFSAVARLLCAVLVTVSVGRPPAGAAQTQAPTRATATFAERIAALSEPEGYFDTDNLISNEQAYLTVVPTLKSGGVQGGAYLGVGPDQNFSYIAAIRPAVAVIVDIRRDNMLLHLLFKALFATSRTRLEYMALLTGRALPTPPADWSTRPIEELVSAIDQTAALNAADVQALRIRLTADIRAFGVPLSASDLATIDRFHRQFIDAGLGLRFQSAGRAPQAGYPTLRQLILATDGTGRHANYLASEEAFQFVKGLEAKDLIIPIVGNLSGPSALRAVAGFLQEKRERVSAFYTSNVEFYLQRDGSFPRFLANLNGLPRLPNAVVIRSIFGGGGSSISTTERVSDLLGR